MSPPSSMMVVPKPSSGPPRPGTKPAETGTRMPGCWPDPVVGWGDGTGGGVSPPPGWPEPWAKTTLRSTSHGTASAASADRNASESAYPNNRDTRVMCIVSSVLLELGDERVPPPYRRRNPSEQAATHWQERCPGPRHG